MKFADVYVGYPLNTSFTYRAPEGMAIEPGKRVRVNFSGRKTVAFVNSVHDIEPEGFEIKNIIEVIDDEPIFDLRLVDLAKYVASSYISTVGETLSLAIPSGLKPSKRYKIPFEKRVLKSIQLNARQKEIYNDIISAYEKGKMYHLIFGITGSGKTELYIEVARYLIKQGLSVIYLVPEISLSSQIFERLYNLFGEKLVIYHSLLTGNQRLHNWMRFYKGDAKIAVGTRSASFLQCPKLGMIIIDEEHDGSYKEHSSPRYNAKRIAFYRSRAEKALVVMGSATPSIESLYACEKGIIRQHNLKERYGNARIPEIDIVKINTSKASSMISSVLKLHTKRAVDRGKQAIYLLNRRGFSPMVICNECGWVVACPRCNISMNFHRKGNMLCHYCGYSNIVPDTCGKCGSEDIVKLGSGTQRIEELITEQFKSFRVFRLDQDSSRKKSAVPEMIEKMNSGEVDILIGTQLVAKGFDFHNITVVGVLLADIGMNLPDFRSSERIFSLLIQVAGRSGRGDFPGKVIVQTIDDDNPIFKFIKDQDYYGFYKSELSMRKMLDYPPFSRLARLLVRGKNEEMVMESVSRLKQALDEAIDERGADIIMLGPSSAPFEKIANNYRHHIILKSKDIEDLRKVIINSKEAVSGRDVYLEIDIDPFDLL